METTLIGVEATIMFMACIFFTVMYVLSESKLFGVLTFGSWNILGLLWLFLVAEPMEGSVNVYATYSVGLFFNGIGILFIAIVLIQWLDELKQKKLGEDEEELFGF